MSLSSLIFRNLKKNIKNYYLYVFALMFSVALYFSFVTLQYDPAMDEYSSSIKGGAALRAASVLLVAIVAIFLLYANNIFIKRRGKEIGLFQLIGLTKGKIFRILSSENLLLYYGSMIVGILIGFSVSRLLLMVLFRVIGVEARAELNFSSEALIQTVIVFSAVYLLIMAMNYAFIKRQSILSLFRVVSTAENRVKKMSVLEMLVGLLGIGLILLGYFISTKLFGGDFVEMKELFLAMIVILASVIIGTYLFYKGSVSFLFNVVRRSKRGYLSLSEVLSLSSIMFRMKSNAVLLTIITTVSALAIGLLSLSYISYYSAEHTAQQSVPNDFSVMEEGDIAAFTEALNKAGIGYELTRRDVIQMNADASDIIDMSLAGGGSGAVTFPVVSDASLEGVDVAPDEVLLDGSNDALMKMLSLRETGEVVFKGKKESIPLRLAGLSKHTSVSLYYSGNWPSAIVDQSVFERLAKDADPALQRESSVYVGIDITDSSKQNEANELFRGMGLGDKTGGYSQYDIMMRQKTNMGLVMFIVAFLGLTFLITSGCILYFKQMGESEEEKPSYTILRKLGFTPGNLVRGIQFKQLFNFGIPLAVGLVHSYFAVQSGWFLFGTELWTPMVLVMLLYTALYSVFGLLSVLYYKRVIKESL
ncbi:FtsX-like permease family protein [Paenibacillus thailandensis]|uniref:FtsX-like permease family protein n=1 Tax=Paenibacillus thailandensis TaxID=393250 RepID=A0ABW5R531_9BACL